jgi:hypothetical protein
MFWGSRITKNTGEERVKGNCYSRRKDPVKWTKSILPILQTRQQRKWIYAEAIPILCGESLFKIHNVYNSVEFTKYLFGNADNYSHCTSVTCYRFIHGKHLTIVLR